MPNFFQISFIIAFVCHHNSLLIFDSLKKPTLNRFAAVTHFSTGISMIACMLMALSGYLVFTDKTEGTVIAKQSLNEIISLQILIWLDTSSFYIISVSYQVTY